MNDEELEDFEAVGGIAEPVRIEHHGIGYIVRPYGLGGVSVRPPMDLFQIVRDNPLRWGIFREDEDDPVHVFGEVVPRPGAGTSREEAAAEAKEWLQANVPAGGGA